MRPVCAKQKIRLDNSSMVMSVGESRKLKLDRISSKNQNGVSWKSSDKGIISVSRTGFMVKASCSKSFGKTYCFMVMEMPFLDLSDRNGSRSEVFLSGKYTKG